MCVGKMAQQTIRLKVILALVRKNGQTYTELWKSAKINQTSCTRALEQLDEENIVVKNTDNEYLFSHEVKNKVLKKLPRAYELTSEFEDFTRKLNDEKSTIKLFVSAEMKLQELLRAQIMIKMERYASLKLNARDTLEFDLYEDIFDGCIEIIFDIAKKRNPQKTQLMKKHLYEFLATK
jgi:predicted transcriptional regulator